MICDMKNFLLGFLKWAVTPRFSGRTIFVPSTALQFHGGGVWTVDDGYSLRKGDDLISNHTQYRVATVEPLWDYDQSLLVRLVKVK
jgi:hypothetical protein